jgi:hypothetical protein
LCEAGLVEFFGRQRCVRGTESDSLGEDLLDAATGTDRLIVQPDSGFGFVGIGPFTVNGVGESGAGAGYVGGAGGSDRKCDGKTGRDGKVDVSHLASPVLVLRVGRISGRLIAQAQAP